MVIYDYCYSSWTSGRFAQCRIYANMKNLQLMVPPKERTLEYYECLERWKKGKISARAAAKQIGTHYATFYDGQAHNIVNAIILIDRSTRESK